MARSAGYVEPQSVYIQLFYIFELCYYRDDYKHSCARLNTKEDQHCYFEFKISNPGEYYFSLNQVNRRFFKREKGYRYSYCTLTIGRLDADDQITYIGSVQKADKEAMIEA